MTDKELQKLRRAYTASPTDENLVKLRNAQARAGLPLEKIKRKVYLEYTEGRSGGEPEDPDDQWSYHSDEYIDFVPKRLALTRSAASWLNETIDVDFIPEEGKPVYLVYVSYETGSTFGRIIGVWQMIGVFEDRNRVEKIRGMISKFNSGEGVKDFADKMSKLTGQEYFYASWVGYFERFIETVVQPMVLHA